MKINIKNRPPYQFEDVWSEVYTTINNHNFDIDNDPKMTKVISISKRYLFIIILIFKVYRTLFIHFQNNGKI